MSEITTRDVQTNFTAGELSPLLEGRPDFDKYKNGLKTLENCLVFPHGGFTKRAGTHFIAGVKTNSKKVRLIPFVYDADTAYICEFGDLYIRFYTGQGRLEEAAKTITGAVDNGAGLIRITATAHGYSTGYAVRAVSVGGVPNATGDWVITVINADTFDLVGSTFAGLYTSGGTSKRIVEIASPYLEADLPKIKFLQFGNAIYIAHPSYEIRKLTRVTSTSFVLKTPTIDPVPSIEAPTDLDATLTLSAASGLGVTATAGSAVFLASDVGRDIASDGGGLGVIKSLTSSTIVVIDVLETFEGTSIANGAWDLTSSPNTSCTPSIRAPIGAAGTLTLAADGWRSALDVGKFVHINGGTFEIISVQSATSATAVCRGELTKTDAAIGGVWRLEVAAWSSAFGFPNGIGLHEQRLWPGGNTKLPQTAWGSKIDDLENFNVGLLDDDSIEFTIAAKQINTIVWLVGGDSLLIGTIGGVFVAIGSQEEPITPTFVDVKEASSFGSDPNVSPLKVGAAILYVQRPGLKLRELAFAVSAGGIDARDLTILSDHITAGGITDMAYQTVPESVVWLVRSDGVLVSFTYEKAHEVLSWARHITKRSGGTDVVESVAVIPGGSGKPDEVWISVKRTIGGGTVRYIEFLDRTSNAANYYGTLQLDCALTYNGAPATVFAGLNHLNGESVYAIGDGIVSGPYTVSSNQITISPAASKCEIGLTFVPIGVTMRPEIPVNAKTGQGMRARWARIRLRLYNTGENVTINGETVDDQLPNAPALFTGDVEVMNLGSEEDEGRVTISQNKPLPLTVLMLTGVLDLGD